MLIKNWVAAIQSHEVDMQERMFRLITGIALIALLIAFLMGILMGEHIVDLIMLGAGFWIILLITGLSLKYNKIRAGSNIIAFITVFGVLPVSFMTGGAMYGGAPLWFVLCAVYLSLVVRGKERFAFYIVLVLVGIVCYYLSYFYPETVSEHTKEVAYMDSMFSLFIVSFLICVLCRFETLIYANENKLAIRQTKEIEELNEAQNHFFSSMSHEIRTPINTIIGLNEMILRENISDEVADDARNIQAASKMLLQLINDILDMSKIESGNMEIVPVVYESGDMLSEIVGMIWMRAKDKGLAFHVDVDPMLPRALYGDEVRIKQILINLLNNAVKYTKQGEIKLSIQSEKQNNGKVKVNYSVSDTGMGIKKESIPHLFTAFKRVDEEKNRHIEGTGLGLSIVRQFVDLMGGEITVNSIYTKGSTFTVELEQGVADEERLGEINIESRHSMNSRQSYQQSFEAPDAHILIVDDNLTNLLVAEKLLRDTKVQIETASSGKEALIKTLETHFDVVFMDHLMPEMDGIQCMHQMKVQVGGLCKDTPVVVLTANAGSDNQAIYSREGFDGYLLKPVSGEELESELLKFLPENLVIRSLTEEAIGEINTTVQKHAKKIPTLVTTDSVCDLPKRYIDRYGIPVLPYRVHTGEGVFLDGVETETEGLLAYLDSDEEKKVCSEPPDEEEYEAFFAEQLSKAQNVIHITMADKVSEGYHNAKEAAKIFGNVTVVNSGHLSSGMGFIVLYANRLANKGVAVENIVAEIERMRSFIHTSFVVDSTAYLTRAGRMNSRVNAFSKAFMLHPVLVLKDSKMKVGKICFGTRVHYWEKYINTALDVFGEIDKKLVFITHAGLGKEELDKIAEKVRKKVVFEKVVYQQASPAISTNCGPGSFGILFQTIPKR